MKEIAKVKKVSGEIATVYMEKKTECSKCGMCIFPKNAKGVDIVARNSLNAKEGDNVIIDIKESGKLLGFFLVFIVPLLLILLELFFGQHLYKNQLISLGVDILAIVIWYSILPFIDKKLKTSNKYGTEIISILPLSNKEIENNDLQENKND